MIHLYKRKEEASMKAKVKGFKKYRIYIICLIAVGVVVLISFYMDANRDVQVKEKDVEVTELSKLINKDLGTSYPDTPREVIRFYNRIITCFYGEKLDEDELIKLANQMKLLFDDELIEKNDLESYSKLKEDIATYDAENRTISTSILDSSGNVEYKTFQEKQYAMLNCIYYTKSDAGTAKTTQQYTLRKDEAGRWKILFWTLVEKEEDD